MQITWYGHSCFLLESADGTRVLTDPCDPETGYRLHDLAADIVTVSHNHHDHGCLGALAGTPKVLSAAGTEAFASVRITGFPSWHDAAQGKLRGPNLIFRIELDGLTVVHLGDLGHLLDADFASAIGRVDVLMCPIGGVYTIDAPQAIETTHLLKPRVLIPMHYATPTLKFALDGLDQFLPLVQTYRVHRLNGSTCSIAADTLGERRVLILDYRK